MTGMKSEKEEKFFLFFHSKRIMQMGGIEMAASD